MLLITILASSLPAFLLKRVSLFDITLDWKCSSVACRQRPSLPFVHHYTVVAAVYCVAYRQWHSLNVYIFKINVMRFILSFTVGCSKPPSSRFGTGSEFPIYLLGGGENVFLLWHGRKSLPSHANTISGNKFHQSKHLI